MDELRSSSVQDESIQALENQLAALRRAQAVTEAKKAQLAEEKRNLRSKVTGAKNLDPGTSMKNNIPKFLEMISFGEEATPSEVNSADGEILKVVCGLPCNSRRREKELNYTLDVLTGTRPREMKSKGEVIKVEKKVEKSKIGLKKAAAKRRIL